MTPEAIFAAPAPRVFTIAPGRPFLDDLAAALRSECGDDPLALADCLIFTPTRRAARALADAFARTAPHRASLLPRIRPLGDIDEDELLLDGTDDLDLPPAVSPLERKLALARLVAAGKRAFQGQESWPAAIAAAGELATLLDSLYTEEIPLDRLKTPPDGLAAHWERALEFLNIVLEAWPAYLRERGLTDPSERRVRLIDAEARRLEERAPQTPVVVAGSTGRAPATARLISVVARLPKGAVVLPGLDRELDPKGWEAIDETHAHWSLKAVLRGIGVTREGVRWWPHSAPVARARLLSLALRPAAATDDWRAQLDRSLAEDPDLLRAAEGLSLIEARDQEAEAAAIAYLMRETLETPGKTAMLVTPDRLLARRVSAKLKRWRIDIEDSAGVPFASTPCGAFLRLVAEALQAPSDPVALLSLARHPLAGFSLDDWARARAVEALDRGLRGLAPGPGIAGLRAKLETQERIDRCAALVDSLEQAAKLWPQEARAPFAALLAKHLEAAELLASDNRRPGTERLWRGEDGEKGATFLAELADAAERLGEIAREDYAPAFAQLLSGFQLRSSRQAHPRLAILGPLEARLQSADHVVLGGLNEGVWPPASSPDPFVPPAVREAIGLPPLEWRVGLAAHDFAEHACCPRTTLTRACVADGAPTKPSRWLVRLRNLLASAKVALDGGADALAACAALDRPETVRSCPPPEPRPPVAARPRRLSVTQFEKLMRDPYSVYAQFILRLRALDPLAEPFGPGALGNLVHAVMHDFAKAEPPPEIARSELRRLLYEHARRIALAEAELALFGPRLEDALDWLLDWHLRRGQNARPVVIEGKGEWPFAVGASPLAAPFVLTARADRIDLLTDGKAEIVDYKSGRLPTLKQVKADFKPQLPLTALIVAAGGFPELGPREVSGFHYVKAYAQDDGDNMRGVVGGEAAAFIAEAREGFARLVEAFDRPATPYLSQPRPEFRDDWSDFDRLARRREWAAEEEDA
jgi:ATP-dependent helicase/nuclease subunit B